MFKFPKIIEEIATWILNPLKIINSKKLKAKNSEMYKYTYLLK
jgi:hypothetical protein